MIKNKLKEDKESKLASLRNRLEYSSQIKKPKIDEALRDKLINQIKNPTTFMGRQSAHAEVQSLNTEAAVPRSAFLSALATPYPEVNMSSFGTGRNSFKSQLAAATMDGSSSIKKDRDYIRRII